MVPSKRNTLKTWRQDYTSAIYNSVPLEDATDGSFLAGVIYKSSASAGRMIVATSKKIFEKTSAKKFT